MPAILVVLFTIALLITCIGLFLSPKASTSPRRSRRSYSAAPKVRRVDTAVIPEREDKARVVPPASARRRVVASTSDLVTAEEGRAMASTAAAAVPARASRGAKAFNLDMDVQRSRPRMKTRVSPTGASIAWPPFRGGLEELLWSWKVAVPGLIALFLLSLYLFVTVFPHQAVWMPVWFGVQNAQAAPKPTAASYNASQRLIRLGQLDIAQYNSSKEYDTWAYSACSAASMTVVINAYGHHYRITDILTVESQIHEITPDQGLLEEIGIQRTGAKFGFKTVWGHNYTLDQIIAAANKGTPVIVSFPPARWPGGHILVVRGGDKNNVLLTDSSRLNMTQFTRQHFLELWGGFYAIMTPA